MLGFRDYFTPRQGYFSVFARATTSLSVYQEYLALESGLPRFTQDFTSLALLRYPLGPTRLRVRGYHPLWPTFPGRSARLVDPISQALQPQVVNHLVWALTRSLAATDAISDRFLFLRLLRCFNSPGLASLAGSWGLSHGVAPFGNSGIIAPVQLPRTYRSLARPSSPLIA